MNAFIVLVTLFLIRLVVPFGLLLWIGDRIQKHEHAEFYGKRGVV